MLPRDREVAPFTIHFNSGLRMSRTLDPSPYATWDSATATVSWTTVLKLAALVEHGGRRVYRAVP